MVKQPNCCGYSLPRVTRLIKSPSGAQFTPWLPLKKKIPVGNLALRGVANQSNTAVRHMVQATDSLGSITPLVVRGLFFGLGSEFDPLEPPQLTTEQVGDDIDRFEILLSEGR
jgi:hypothetical protein